MSEDRSDCTPFSVHVIINTSKDRDPDRRETEKRETEERETEKRETEKWETEMQ